MKTGVLVVDDHRIFRECVRSLLDRQDEMAVLGEAEDGQVAIELTRRLLPQVVLMDVTLPRTNGIDATRQILQAVPRVKVIALSMHAEARVVHAMLAAGAAGYLLKECATAEFLEAIRVTVGLDQIYLSPGISRIVLDEYLHPTPGMPGEARGLTGREREVLQAVAEGQANRQIARRLGLSTRTVENHRAHVMRKLGLSSVADLVRYALREGLTPP